MPNLVDKHVVMKGRHQTQNEKIYWPKVDAQADVVPEGASFDATHQRENAYAKKAGLIQ